MRSTWQNKWLWKGFASVFDLVVTVFNKFFINYNMIDAAIGSLVFSFVLSIIIEMMT